DVVVKFCKTYHARAYTLLSDHDLAPKLHLSAEVGGWLHMIVMDFQPKGDVYAYFRETHAGTTSDDRLPGRMQKDIEKAVQLLHEHDIMLGDLRRPNVMVVEREGQGGGVELGGMLVDFDWAADEGR
ncbi:hypothetical protein BC834DRAFT_818925, partial [Gloeopeniophorella convolvens]